MLDVHAPHANVHTWKDFLIHIAIITIGLLIAIQAARDRFAFACERIDALHTRYASTTPDKTGESWLVNQEQANEVADAAAAADSALKALIWRARWNLRFEEGIVDGAKNYDEVLMTLAGGSREK